MNIPHVRTDRAFNPYHNKFVLWLLNIMSDQDLAAELAARAWFCRIFKNHLISARVVCIRWNLFCLFKLNIWMLSWFSAGAMLCSVMHVLFITRIYSREGLCYRTVWPSPHHSSFASELVDIPWFGRILQNHKTNDFLLLLLALVIKIANCRQLCTYLRHWLTLTIHKITSTARVSNGIQ